MARVGDLNAQIERAFEEHGHTEALALLAQLTAEHPEHGTELEEFHRMITRPASPLPPGAGERAVRNTLSWLRDEHASFGWGLWSEEGERWLVDDHGEPYRAERWVDAENVRIRLEQDGAAGVRVLAYTAGSLPAADPSRVAEALEELVGRTPPGARRIRAPLLLLVQAVGALRGARVQEAVAALDARYPGCWGVSRQTKDPGAEVTFGFVVDVLHERGDSGYHETIAEGETADAAIINATRNISTMHPDPSCHVRRKLEGTLDEDRCNPNYCPCKARGVARSPEADTRFTNAARRLNGGAHE